MLDSEIIIFLAGFISSGIIRISFGTLVLREEGRWKFKLKRFDEKDEARINAWNDGFNCGLAEAAKWHDAQALELETTLRGFVDSDIFASEHRDSAKAIRSLSAAPTPEAGR